MAIKPSPSVVTNGLAFYYDMGNIKSWKGFPTTNLNSLAGIGIYNNVPAHVTATLATTGETYLGAPVYRLTLTPTTATGVSYLTAGNNPGIGVVTGGGGGLANRYTGHSIFFRTTVPMHTNPIWTHYSNIGGWQSSANYDRTSDGWYRAFVTFYSSSGGSDGKYWAINPASATLNTPIVIYWAAPFKEDSNVNTFVSPYVETSRSSTTSLLDMTGNNTIGISSLTYNSDGSFSFNNGSNWAQCTNNCGITGNITLSAFIKPNVYTGGEPHKTVICTDIGYPYGAKLMTYKNYARYGLWLGFSGTTSFEAFASGDINDNTNKMFTASWDMNAGTVKLYLNGTLQTTITGAPTSPVVLYDGKISIGAEYHSVGNGFYGNIYTSMVYNRALSDAEVAQNFNALRRRFGL